MGLEGLCACPAVETGRQRAVQMEAVDWPLNWPCLQDPWLALLSSLPTPPLALALAGS